MTDKRRVRAASAYLSVFVFMAAESALHVLVPPYLAVEHHLRPAAIGLVVGVFALASLIARFPIGAFYTFARARRILLVGGTLSVVAFALLPVAPNALWLAAVMALDGLGWSMATTVQLAVLVATRSKGMRTGAVVGWYAGLTGLGNASAGVAAGLLGDHVGLRQSFLVLAAALAVGTLLIVRALPTDGGVRVVATDDSQQGLRRTIGAFGALPALLWASVLVMFFINFVNGVVATFHPVLVLAAGLSLTQIGVLAACRGWASSITRIGSGLAFARFDMRGLTTPLLLLGALGMFLIPAVRSSFVLQVPLFVAMGLSRGLLRVTASADAFDAVGDAGERHGVTAAVLHAGLDAGKVAGPVVGGIVAQIVGIATMLQLVPAVLVALYAVFALAGRRTEPATVRAS